MPDYLRNSSAGSIEVAEAVSILLPSSVMCPGSFCVLSPGGHETPGPMSSPQMDVKESRNRGSATLGMLGFREELLGFFGLRRPTQHSFNPS